jgi:hypothetical protein
LDVAARYDPEALAARTVDFYKATIDQHRRLNATRPAASDS